LKQGITTSEEILKHGLEKSRVEHSDKTDQVESMQLIPLQYM